MSTNQPAAQKSPKQLDLAAAGYAPAKHLPAYAVVLWRLREQRAAERASKSVRRG